MTAYIFTRKILSNQHSRFPELSVRFVGRDCQALDKNVKLWNQIGRVHIGDPNQDASARVLGFSHQIPIQ